jgi:hypothetical protein
MSRLDQERRKRMQDFLEVARTNAAIIGPLKEEVEREVTAACEEVRARHFRAWQEGEPTRCSS